MDHYASSMRISLTHRNILDGAALKRGQKAARHETVSRARLVKQHKMDLEEEEIDA